MYFDPSLFEGASQGGGLAGLFSGGGGNNPQLQNVLALLAKQRQQQPQQIQQQLPQFHPGIPQQAQAAPLPQQAQQLPQNFSTPFGMDGQNELQKRRQFQIQQILQSGLYGQPSR